jgi:predicted phosphohydrolase
MKIYAISDLHLNNSTNKPMDIFGEQWIGHWDKIKVDWNSKVTEDDIVLVAGDISWAMSLSDAMVDLISIGELKGHKFLIRGNHDYWWSSYSKITKQAPDGISFLQNNAIKLDKYIICGTRGWTVPEDENNYPVEDKKIFDRELIRLSMCLESAKKLQTSGEEIIVMMHYPPFNSNFADSEFTKLIDKYNIKKVIYGHLHGNKSRYKLVVNKHSTDYYLTSCDILNNQLLEIIY